MTFRQFVKFSRVFIFHDLQNKYDVETIPNFPTDMYKSYLLLFILSNVNIEIGAQISVTGSK